MSKVRLHFLKSQEAGARKFTSLPITFPQARVNSLWVGRLGVRWKRVIFGWVKMVYWAQEDIG